jgi:hypothetical protein
MKDKIKRIGPVTGANKGIGYEVARQLAAFRSGRFGMPSLFWPDAVTGHDGFRHHAELYPCLFFAVVPFHAIVSDRSSPSRVRSAAPLARP